MKLKSILTETIDNLFNDNEKTKYVNQVWNIIQQSYEPVGGIRGTGFNNIEDMIKNIPMWKIYRIGEDVKAIMMYKDTSGRKRVAIGTDGTLGGKTMMMKMLKDEYLTKRSYSEVSGPSLKVIRKILLPTELEKFMIPVDDVIKLLSDKEIIPIDKFAYKRRIGGTFHEKIMLGKPNVKFYKK